ncbi:ATP12 family chaperone protein [Caulobacter sp. S45]|uniref:ATP12 family chaperone protein n=1 Tax=Caulobacter sp. S45 TaxID=1641861 RepID=UPI00157543B3|nr:ATP12 family protein [Caulobacter sp. S45]
MRPSSSSSERRPRRFYKQVEVAPEGGGFTLLLDGRGAKTPGGAALRLPALGLAELVAAEWDAQSEQIDLSAMPANRLASTVIDRTAAAGAAVAAEVARYAGSDVLCYFAEAPASLVEAQVARWGPLLDWARDSLGVELHRVAGVAPRPQPREALGRVEALVAGLEPFTQAGVAFVTPLFGSAILALALHHGQLHADAAFDLSRLEQAYQEERWGVDAEAAERTTRQREEARMVGRWFEALAGRADDSVV